MNENSSTNTDNSNVNNFHTSDNHTVDQTPTLVEVKRKRTLKVICFIVAILLIIVVIVVSTILLLEEKTDTMNNSTTQTSITSTASSMTAETLSQATTTKTVSQSITTKTVSQATTTKTASQALTTKIVSQAITTEVTTILSTVVTTIFTTNISDPISTACTSDRDRSLFENEFLYSPTSQRYAAGLLNGQFGVYEPYGYDNVTSYVIWLADQKSQPGVELKLQRDRNLIVYGNSEALWGAGGYNGGDGGPFCLKLLDSGNLVWINNDEEIIWQTDITVK
ncbi:hypothetical protein I4U23_016031 [Adineta vaga]|nr:hypothetical protein I4U23_016031 [Adineta vaga]